MSETVFKFVDKTHFNHLLNRREGKENVKNAAKEAKWVEVEEEGRQLILIQFIWALINLLKPLQKEKRKQN